MTDTQDGTGQGIKDTAHFHSIVPIFATDPPHPFLMTHPQAWSPSVSEIQAHTTAWICPSLAHAEQPTLSFKHLYAWNCKTESSNWQNQTSLTTYYPWFCKFECTSAWIGKTESPCTPTTLGSANFSTQVLKLAKLSPPVHPPSLVLQIQAHKCSKSSGKSKKT